MPSQRDDIRCNALVVLYSAGWSDSRISDALGMAFVTVRKLREARGLPRNRPAHFKIDDDVARQMYDEGATDFVIARHFGTHHTAVLLWRRRQGLPPIQPAKRISEGERRQIYKMLKQGSSRGQVAEAVGVSKETVQAYRNKLNHPDMRPTGVTNWSIAASIRRDPTITRRIERAIGRAIPAEVRLDAVSDLYTDVLEGRVASSCIEKVAPGYRNRAMEISGNGWGRRSLDDPLGEDWTLGDTLEDPHALDEIELAAEAVFNDN